MNLKKYFTILIMIVVSHTTFAQYPTTKIIKGQEVVIMTVPQARAIDDKFFKLKDSIKLINVSLFQNRENLKLTNQSLTKTNMDLSKTQDSLKQTLILNNFYLKEIEKYKTMEFEDKKVQKRVTIGVVTALTVWIALFIGSMSK